MAKQTVTLSAGTLLFDASVYIAGKGLFLLSNNAPAKLVQFPNLNDLTTQNVFTFANDTKHNGAAQPNLTYDRVGGYLYAAFTWEDGTSGDESTRIVRIDPSNIATQVDPFAEFVMGTNSIPQGGVSIVNDGVSLWVMTKPQFENTWLARVNIAAPTTRDGTNPISPVQVTGTGHVRGHAFGYDDVTTKLYFAGSKFTGGKLAWTGWALPDLSSHSIIDVSTTKGLSDDISFIGSSYFLNYENEDSPSATVVKVAKDLSGTTDYSTGGGAFTLDGQWYDGSGLWVAVLSNPCVLKKIDPATGAVLASVSLDSGENTVNEINPYYDASHLILTTGQSPSKAIRQPLGPVSPPLVPAFARVGYF